MIYDYSFNNYSICGICKRDEMCTEVLLTTAENEQKVELWCQDCIRQIEYLTRKQEEKEGHLEDLYQSIINSQH